MSSSWKLQKLPESGPSDTEDMLAPEAEEIPTFPLHCFPPILRSYINEVARVTTVQNVPLTAAFVLGAISASVGVELRVASGGGRVTRGNLYIIGIAESGSGKSETFEMVFEPFHHAENAANADFNRRVVPQLRGKLKVAEAGLASLLKQMAGGRSESPKQPDDLSAKIDEAEEEVARLRVQLEAVPCWKVGDITKEALAMTLAGQPNEVCASLCPATIKNSVGDN